MLPINYKYKNLSERDKAFLSDYCPKKLDRFETLMTRYKESECRLEVKAEAFATKAAYMVEMVLHLPGKVLMAKEDDHTMIEATDLAVDKLIIQLRKFTNRNQ
jgi:ribosomal subunit interface protein